MTWVASPAIMKITDNKALNAVTIVCSSFNKAILFYKILTEIDLIPRLQAKNVTQVSKRLFAALKSISKYVHERTNEREVELSLITSKL